MGALDELGDVARKIENEIGPAVVSIGRDGRGTGVVIADGKVLTNAHNLRDRTTTVTFGDGRSVQGSVSGADGDGDLVVLAVDTASVTPIQLSESELRTGDIVFAAARSHRGLRITFGMVSGTGRSFRGPRGRHIQGSVEHTAAMAPGSSGGPLLSAAGTVAGINTNRLGRGFYLARPTDPALRDIVSRLSAGESVEGRRLGVSVVPPEVAAKLRRSVGLAERAGLLVRGVDADSPAAAAGIEPGDLLVAADGRALERVETLHEVLSGSGDTIDITVVRGVEERTVTISFVSEPAGPSAASESAG